MAQFFRLFRFQEAYLLTPVFMLALGVSPNMTRQGLYWTCAIVHLLLYPSVGILAFRARDERFHAVLGLAILFCAIALGFLQVNTAFGTLLIVYAGLRMLPEGRGPFGKYTSVAVRYGFLGFAMCYLGVNRYDLRNLGHEGVLIPALMAGMIVPLWNPDLVAESQVRGEAQIVRHLRFRLGAGVPAIILATVYFYLCFKESYAIIAMACFLLLMIGAYLTLVHIRRSIDINGLMIDSPGVRLRAWYPYLGATVINAFLIYFFLDSSQILQAIQAGF